MTLHGKHGSRRLRQTERESAESTTVPTLGASAVPVSHRSKSHWSWGKRLTVAFAGLVVLAGAAVLAAFLLGRPSVSVSAGSASLVDVHAGGLGARIDSVHATTGGNAITLVSSDGGLSPSSELAQSQQVTVTATASAPSWLAWLVGSKVTVTKTVETPASAPSATVALASGRGEVPIAFDHPVSVVDYRVSGGVSQSVKLSHPSSVADLAVPKAEEGGTLEVSAAPAAWEKTDSRTSTISWFVAPSDGAPAALVEPSPGSSMAASNGPITLTFDQPVSRLLGSRKPTLSPSVPGTWAEPAANTLVFTPSGFGFGPGATVTVSFGRRVMVIGQPGAQTATTSATTAERFTYNVAPGSLLRLDQILAQLRYLPLVFTPSAGVVEPTTFSQEVATLGSPLQGAFSWRWSSTPAALQAQWSPGAANVMLKGALMQFIANEPNSDYDGYQLTDESVSQILTPSLWEAVLQAAAANRVDPSPYSYVYVSETITETMTLWENGSVAMDVPANTGIAQDPTALGTYPIYVRYLQNWMNGTNPDGTPYHDLVYWINYFNGSDAVHGFNRASYGYPQSLGCVELPVATAQVAFGDLAIGDLVTVVS